MTSVSMIVAKKPAVAGGQLDRVLLARRGRPRRAAVAHHVGIGAIVAWVAASIALAVAWRSEAIGTIAVVGLLVVPVAAFAARWGASHPVVAIAVHDAGLVRRERGRALTLAWTEIAEVFEHTFEHDDMLGTELRGAFTFVAHDGRTLVIDSGVPDWLELGKMASALAEDTLRAGYELGLVAGRPLRFGDLVLDTYGAHAGGVSIPWSAITFVRFERRGHDAAWAIHVAAWIVAARIPHPRVANTRTLVAILERLGKLDVPSVASAAA